MTTERKLDDALDLLGRARPRLDEITRARVASKVEAALREQPTEAAPTPAPVRRWPRRLAIVTAGVATVGVAAAGVLVLAAPSRTAPPPVEEAAPAPAPAGPAKIDVAAGESRHLELGATAITVYGPGRLDGDAERATVHAAAIVVDRPHDEAAPWSLRYDDITVVASRATFAVDRGTAVRVTVMRGEVLLLCEDGPHPVPAGDTAECPRPTASSGDRPRVRSTPDAVAAPPDAAVPDAGVGPGSAPAVVDSPPPAPVRLVRAPVAPVMPPPELAPPLPAPPPPAPPPSPPEPVPDEAFAMQEPIAATPNLYRLAEGAMRRGDRDGARVALNAVINENPSSIDAANALLDLAMLAHKEGNDPRAHGYLDRLDRHLYRAGLLAPAARLRAQLEPR